MALVKVCDICQKQVQKLTGKDLVTELIKNDEEKVVYRNVKRLYICDDCAGALNEATDQIVIDTIESLKPSEDVDPEPEPQPDEPTDNTGDGGDDNTSGDDTSGDNGDSSDDTQGDENGV